jgi:hypothetical protein
MCCDCSSPVASRMGRGLYQSPAPVAYTTTLIIDRYQLVYDGVLDELADVLAWNNSLGFCRSSRSTTRTSSSTRAAISAACPSPALSPATCFDEEMALRHSFYFAHNSQ